MLTDPTFIRRLESLYLLARKVLNGTLQSDRKSTKKGSGINFADYSEYSLGDDWRAIDWRVYARLETLMIKLFELEEDVTIHILLDCSKSMASKLEYAKQLAAALGYIGLHNLDKVVIYAMADEIRPILMPSHGRGKTLSMLQSLQDATLFGNDTNFTDCTKALQVRHRRRGVVIAISDFLFPTGFEEGLKFLQWHKNEVFCLQVQDKNDLKCDFKGDVELECVESGRLQKVTVTEQQAKQYEQAIADWNESLAKTCAKQGIGIASITTETPFDEVIRNILRRGGLVA